MQFPKHINTINAYLREGFDERGWYNETSNKLREIFEDDAGLVADLLAATSPNTSVAGNVTLALKAYQQLKNGKDFVGFLPIVVKMLHTIRLNYLTDEHMPFGGAKIQNFARALKGDLSAVVVDRWMVRAFGYPKITPLRTRKITAWVNARAAQLGVTPCEIQAAIWCGIKRREDASGFTTAPIDSYLRSA